MNLYSLMLTIETFRKDMHDLSEKLDFNLQDPQIITKSKQLDKLILTFITITFYIVLIQQISE